MDLVDEKTRSGSSMYLEENALVIEIRHIDSSRENEKYRQLTGRMRKWLKSIM